MGTKFLPDPQAPPMRIIKSLFNSGKKIAGIELVGAREDI